MLADSCRPVSLYRPWLAHMAALVLLDPLGMDRQPLDRQADKQTGRVGIIMHPARPKAVHRRRR